MWLVSSWMLLVSSWMCLINAWYHLSRVNWCRHHTHLGLKVIESLSASLASLENNYQNDDTSNEYATTHYYTNNVPDMKTRTIIVGTGGQRILIIGIELAFVIIAVIRVLALITKLAV